MVDEAALSIPDPQPPRCHQPRRDAQQAPPAQLDQPAPQDPFAMVEIRQMLQHLGAQMAAVNRIGLAHAEMMRQAHAASHLDFMTASQYAAFVAWPGDQAPASEGGSATPHVMEEDEVEQDVSQAGTEIIEIDDDDDSEEDALRLRIMMLRRMALRWRTTMTVSPRPSVQDMQFVETFIFCLVFKFSF